MSAPSDLTLDVARSALAELELGQTKSAAWYGLWALERNPTCGLAWAVLSRIVLEVTQDPLATLATRRALRLGLPDPERVEFERFHRIDLWTRGLLAHDSGQPLLPVHAFAHPEHFRETTRLATWLANETNAWTDDEGAARALTRLAASLADAWVVPEDGESPLRDPAPWRPTAAFERWSQAAPAPKARPTSTPVAEEKVVVLSDHWMEQSIMSLGAQSSFDLALDRAREWAQLRPDKVRPKAALVRVLHAQHALAERDEAIEALLGLGMRDLNELEEARLALGELELWGPQVRLLDQMNRVAPGHPVILANRGVALLQLGRAEEGERDLEAALVADPDHGPALANLGLQRMKNDEYVAARRLLERAVVVAPDQAQVRVYLAACKNNQDDRGGAILELEKALELEPGHAQARQLLDELKARGPVAKA